MASGEKGRSSKNVVLFCLWLFAWCILIEIFRVDSRGMATAVFLFLTARLFFAGVSGRK